MRLHAHEEKKRQILSKRQQSIEYEEDDERLARQLAKEEQMRYKSTPQSPHGIQEDDDSKCIHYSLTTHTHFSLTNHYSSTQTEELNKSLGLIDFSHLMAFKKMM